MDWENPNADVSKILGVHYSSGCAVHAESIRSGWASVRPGPPCVRTKQCTAFQWRGAVLETPEGFGDWIPRALEETSSSV